jgi:hypothetical protein
MSTQAKHEDRAAATTKTPMSRHIAREPLIDAVWPFILRFLFSTERHLFRHAQCQ